MVPCKVNALRSYLQKEEERLERRSEGEDAIYEVAKRVSHTFSWARGGEARLGNAENGLW